MIPPVSYPSAHPSSSRTAFSVVELLSGLAVIAILAAILVPSFSALMQNAATQKTISNLKQLQAANMQFAGEHGGAFVQPQINGDWAGGMWFQNEAFLSYLGVRRTDRMWDEDWPEVAKSGLRSASPNQPPGKMDRQASLAINLGLRQHWPLPDGSYGSLGFHQSQIRQPSKAMAFADATDTWIRMDRADRWRSDKLAAANGWYDMAIAYRNRGRAAVVFFDGHVALLSPQEVIGNWDLWIPDRAE